MKIRDELCKNGEILLSPALSYTSRHLHVDVEQEKREKLPLEMEEDRLKVEEDKKGMLVFDHVSSRCRLIHYNSNHEVVVHL